jgi:L-fuconolactonase
MRIERSPAFLALYPDEFVWIDDSMSCFRREFLPEHLEPELKRTGFDGSIVVQARQTPRLQSVVAGIKDQT